MNGPEAERPLGPEHALRPVQDGISSALAIVDNDMDRFAEIVRPYRLNPVQRSLVIAMAHVLVTTTENVDAVRERLQAFAHGGGRRAE